ncbi:MAG: hypothetical protein J0M09_14090 [Xanthomonadales bacterium]|nr:hypothetical protein [Xanthomonadales bacterium]
MWTPHAAVALMLCCAITVPAHAALVAMEGNARDPDNHRLLYREAHLIRREGERPVERMVLYRCPNGVAFARKTVDYRNSALAPDFELVDARGYREGLRREQGKPVVWSGKSPARGLGAAKAPLVADAGFDEFMRQRWPQLIAGKPQALAFAVPAFGRSLPFKVRSLGPDNSDIVHHFELHLDGLLGVVASKIRLEYDNRDRRLLHFTGLTNIRDARGDQIEARIGFPQAPQPADAQRWQSAADEPLAACPLGR